MSRFALLLLTALFAALPASAQTARQQLLLLPITLDLQGFGDTSDLDTYRFLQAVEAAAEKQAPNVDLVIPGPGDPRLEGVDLTAEPDPAAAAALGRQFGVQAVGWAKISFSLQHKTETVQSGDVPGQQLQTGDPAPQNLITVGGLAHMGIVDAASGKVLVQGPVALFRSALTRANEGTGGYDDDARNVALECAQDLAAKLVEIAQRRMKSGS